MSELILLALMVAVTGLGIWGGILYKTQSDLKRLDRLTLSLKMGLDYVRNLNQGNSDQQYPQLYKKITQNRKELETLVDKYGSKLEPQRYKEAVSIIHIASALKPKGNFLTEVADSMMDFVTDIFPDAKKVTSIFKSKTTPVNPDIIYQTDVDETDDETLRKIRYVQQVAPEILEIYTSIEKHNQQIVEKLKASALGNKAELLAIHQSNMRNCEDVLDGYLKIKQAPSQFYKSQERLAQGEQILRKVKETLTETLRQINENDLMNFEISLRLLQKNN